MGCDAGVSKLRSMNPAEIAIAIAVGVGLAAACGFRVFVPLFVVAVAHRAGYSPPGASFVGFDWLSSDIALVVLGVATAAEVGAYYIPWVDNLLDTITTPAATIAGTVMMMGVLDGAPEPIQWGVGLLGGGGTALTVQGVSVLTRGASTVATAGFGNPLVSTTENVGSTLLSILAVIIGPIVVVAVVVGLFLLLRKLTRLRRRGADPAMVAALADTGPSGSEEAGDTPEVTTGELALSDTTPWKAQRASRRRMSPMLRGKGVVGLRAKPGG